MALIIGVTGAIATGKSTACEIMTGLGAVHCDADRVVLTAYTTLASRPSIGFSPSSATRWSETTAT